MTLGKTSSQNTTTINLKLQHQLGRTKKDVNKDKDGEIVPKIRVC